jgi:hypothetical protein
VAYRPVTKQWLYIQRPLLNNARNIHACNNRRTAFSMWSVPRSYNQNSWSNEFPTRSRFSVVLLDPRANAELVPRLHVALHASYAALPMVTSKFRPNIALPQTYTRQYLWKSYVLYSKFSRSCTYTDPGVWIKVFSYTRIQIWQWWMLVCRASKDITTRLWDLPLEINTCTSNEFLRLGIAIKTLAILNLSLETIKHSKYLSLW